MGNKISKALLILFLVFGLTSVSFAQRQTGSIKGTVVDEERNALPGATATVSSPDLMGTHSYTTTSTGSFRFPALPPGTYSIRVELPGFQTLIQENIIVSVGKTSEISCTLSPVTIEEEVTVIARSPTVDLESAKIAVTYTKELMKSIPMIRDYYNIVNSAAGVVSDNTPMRRTSSTHGTTVRDSQYNLDGVSMNDPSVSYSMSNFSFDVIAEVEIETGGHPAEVGQAPGAFVNVVTKSGGNDFHGSGNFHFSHLDLVGTNVTRTEMKELGIKKPDSVDKYYDLGFSLGGPILLKDKLWFFASYRWQRQSNNITGFTDTYGEKYKQDESLYFLKLTFQPHPRHNLSLMVNRADVLEPYYRDPMTYGALMEPLACRYRDEYVNTLLGKWNWVISQNAFLDIRAAYVFRHFPLYYQEGATYPRYDARTRVFTGAARYQEIYDRSRIQTNASLTYFRDDFLGGKHEFKGGLEYYFGRDDKEEWSDPPIRQTLYFGDVYLPGTTRGVVWVYNMPRYPICDTNRLSFYLQDALTYGRLSANIGIRADRSTFSLPAQSGGNDNHPFISLDPKYFGRVSFGKMKNLVDWFNISPRIGLTYNLTGDGKTALKTAYNRYYINLMTAMFKSVFNLNARGYINYRWFDLNLNKKIDVGVDRFEETTRSAAASIDADPNTKQSHIDEIIIGLEREVITDLNVGLRYIQKWYKNIIGFMCDSWPMDSAWTPFQVTEPGFDGVLGTGDDKIITVYDLKKEYVKVRQHWLSTNIDHWKRKYRALELTFNKRFSGRWQFFGSVVYAKAEGNLGLGYDYSEGTESFTSPNDLINDYGYLDMDRKWAIKLQGTYQAPLGIFLSASYRQFSGEPLTRNINIYLPNIGAEWNYIYMEPRGSRRNPSLNILDIRVEKRFNVGKLGSMSAFIDAYNVLNSARIVKSKSEQGVLDRLGKFVLNPNWDTLVVSVNSPRTIYFGLRFEF